MGWALRKGYRADRPGPSSRLAAFTRPLARVAVWLLLLTVVGWLALFGAAQRDLDVLFTARAEATILAALSLLSGVFAAVIAVDAAAAWTDPSRGLPRRVGLPLVALAAGTLCVLFFAFDLTSFTTDF